MTQQTPEPEVEPTEEFPHVETKGVPDPHTPDAAEISAPEDESRNSDNLPMSGDSENSQNSANPDDLSSNEGIDEPDTFPRSVVEKLRRENAGYREKAKKAEDYARELFYARVAATGRLADADDLPFDEALLDDHDALTAAVEELVARRPHLALRKPRGDVGAGATADAGVVDLAGILRSRA